MYQWWVFVHVVGVFGFLVSHGVSMTVTFRLRNERDPRRVNDLLTLSSVTTRYFYISLFVLLVGGVVAGFVGKWWSQGWIWGAIIILVLTSMVMYGVATPYYRRVRLVAKAMAGGSHAVTEEQFDSLLRSRRPIVVMAIGFAGLLLILYLMLLKPTLGFSSTQAPSATVTSAASPSSTISLSAKGLAFNVRSISAVASTPLTIVFDNQDPGQAHNVAIYTNSSAATVLFRGAIVTGPRTIDYRAPAMQPGTYYFRCDVHPFMNGSLVVR